MKHGRHTPGCSLKAIEAERVTDPPSAQRAVIECGVLWKQSFICFDFTDYYIFTTFCFVPGS